MIRTVVFIIAFSLCVNAVWAKDEKSIKKLRDALIALAPDVDPGEAELLSVTVHTASRSLAREYRLFLGPIVQNFMITMGKRERGWCGHYARDIGERLKEFKLKTLVLHWGEAEPGTLDESNCLVVTARNQPFEDGIVLDAWRNAGRLFWCVLKKDELYDARHLAERRAQNPFLQHPVNTQHGTIWKENPLYTAWLQDYERAWEWKPTAR